MKVRSFALKNEANGEKGGLLRQVHIDLSLGVLIRYMTLRGTVQWSFSFERFFFKLALTESSMFGSLSPRSSACKSMQNIDYLQLGRTFSTRVPF